MNQRISHFLNIKCAFLTALTILVLFLPQMGQTMAAENKTIDMEVMNEKAKLMEELVNDGQLEEAKKIYGWMDTHFPMVAFEKYNLNTRQISELLRSFDRAGEGVTRVDMREQKRRELAFQFRLAADATVSKKNPLWKKYGEQLVVMIDQIEEQLDKGEVQAARQTYQEWQRRFELLRPAIYIGKEEEEFLPLVSYIRYLSDHSTWLESGNASELERLKTFLQNVLDDKRNDGVDPSLWWVMFSVGGMIVGSLTYAGWKKYKGEKHRQQMRD